MSTKSYYEILGVSVDASLEEIKRAFRSLALRWHPDQNSRPDAKEHFQQIREAYETLIDPEKRSRYNRTHGICPAKDRQKKRVFRKNPASELQCSKIASDIIADYFGLYRECRVTTKCRDLRYDFHFTPAHLENARNETISYVRWVYCNECVGKGLPFRSCVMCRGRGFVEERVTLTVSIPAGCRSGHQIRVRGMGDHTIPEIPAGDLLVYIHVVNTEKNHEK
ncbi:DnaJ domain-containing protein [Thermodesulforhabdus norvegica]|uniref:DnaJ C terminal domain-containing protein n=1 Tax=Thermodesulforhabdus norvegica TaxID=39841 RepID=A0A1I4U4M6_9BACT|nr:DnaJ domain-containing protein [Thermodesulforhabdus norvegica]SFM83996.1 DnaJ C terminal domain-containing protein [Thermodesulforhabdus norvegica]